MLCPQCDKPLAGGLFMCPTCERRAGSDLAHEASRTEALLALAAAGIHIGYLQVTDYSIRDGKITVNMPREEYLRVRASIRQFQDDCMLSATTARFRFKRLDDKLIRHWQAIFGNPDASPPF